MTSCWRRRMRASSSGDCGTGSVVARCRICWFGSGTSRGMVCTCISPSGVSSNGRRLRQAGITVSCISSYWAICRLVPAISLQARRAAVYLSRYVAKTFADPAVRVQGFHRYEVAEGFKPEALRLSASSSDAVIAEASELMSGEPVTRWASSENPDWQGAPAVGAQWGHLLLGSTCRN